MEKKYRLEDNLEKTAATIGSASAIGGLATTIYGLIAQNQETIIGGGFLFSGGALTYLASSIRAYCETKIEYMNEKIDNKTLKIKLLKKINKNSK